MKKGLIITIAIIAALVLFIVLPFVSGYNNLVKKSEEVDAKKANIQTQLQRRNDLIPNLVSTVKGYASHEEEIFTAIADARAKLAGATTMDEINEGETEMTNALNRLIAIAESYPDLKANTTYIGLMDELAGTENRINNARQEYNEAVRSYNTSIRSFPTVIVANLFGFEKAEMFQASDGAQVAPTVNFD